jgi:hypothetical protein
VTDKAQQMTCIWSTSVRLTWGVATLRAIIMNMHTWASRLLKPKIQASVLAVVRQPHPILTIARHTSEVDVNLTGLFSSPQPNTPSPSNLPLATATSLDLLEAEQLPHPSRRDLSAVNLQASSPPPCLESPVVRRYLTPRLRSPKSASAFSLSSPKSVPIQSELVVPPEKRSEAQSSMGAEIHKRIAVTPQSLNRVEDGTKGIQSDMDEITKSFGSCRIQTSANTSQFKHASLSIESNKQPSEATSKCVLFVSPTSDTLFTNSLLPKESGCQLGYKSSTGLTFSNCPAEMSIWTKIERNIPASTGPASIPYQSLFAQPLIGSNAQYSKSSTFTPFLKPFSSPKVPTPPTEPRFSRPKPQWDSFQNMVSLEPEVFVSIGFNEQRDEMKQDTASLEPEVFESFSEPTERVADHERETESLESEVFMSATSTEIACQDERQTATSNPGIFEFPPKLPNKEEGREHGNGASPQSQAVAGQVPLFSRPLAARKRSNCSKVATSTLPNEGLKVLDVGRDLPRSHLTGSLQLTADDTLRGLLREENIVKTDKYSATCGHRSAKNASYPLVVAGSDSANFATIIAFIIAKQTERRERASNKKDCSEEGMARSDSSTCASECSDAYGNDSDGSNVDHEDTETSDLYDIDEDTEKQGKRNHLSAPEDSPENYESEPENLPDTDTEHKHEEESEDEADSDSASEIGVESTSESEDGSEDTSLDSERSAHITWRDLQHLREADQCWELGLGSLNGHQLARVEHLRSLFINRSPVMQVSMIREVVGYGPMKGDRYFIHGQNLLGELIKDLNAHIPTDRRIKSEKFVCGRARSRIANAVDSKLRRRVTHEDRWNCFRYALSIRSRRACRDICVAVPSILPKKNGSG